MKTVCFLWTVFCVYMVSAAGADQPDCIAPPPCMCLDRFVYCQHLNLTAVPTFRDSTVPIHEQLKVYLQGNRIANIPADAFSKLATTRSQDIYIDLSNNHIKHVDDKAFGNITRSLQFLRLNHNKLQSLPKALATLTNIQTLELYQNVIKEFDKATMQSIGKSLTAFNFGATADFSWPFELQYLSKLQTLGITYYIPTSIPSTAFNGFHTSLRTLSIENTNIDAIPQAVCSLANLEWLTFNFNSPHVGKELHVPTCSPVLSFMGLVELSGNNLTRFPNVFGSFPNLVHLRVALNPHLNTIDRKLIPTTGLQLATFQLDHNAFEQIPTVISNMHTLQDIDLSFNKISAIGNSDLANLSSLVYLSFDNNSIVDISDSAFKSCQKLLALYMTGNLLSRFPKAVRDLQVLNMLLLPDRGVACNCGMAWILTQWKHGMEASVYISGYCAGSSQPIKVYITHDLPSCPHIT